MATTTAATTMGTTITDALHLGALALLLVAATGCLQLGDGADPLHDATVTVQPDGFYEVNLRMDGGASIAYAWSVVEGGPAAFDVHSHDGGEVTVHREATTDALDDEFTAPSEGTYSLLWAPDGDAPVRVQLEVSGDAEVESTVPG